MRITSLPEIISRVAKEAGVQAFRGYLSEEYDGIGQYAMVSLSRASSTSSIRAKVAAGDFGTGTVFPEGTPLVLYSNHGQVEILTLGAKP